MSALIRGESQNFIIIDEVAFPLDSLPKPSILPPIQLSNHSLTMPAIDHTTHTIESLIAELTRLAASRGWGAQSLTNIREIEVSSGGRGILLLTGNDKDIDELENELAFFQRNVRSLESEVEELENERDSLRSAVEKLSHEVLTLKEAARDMHA